MVLCNVQEVFASQKGMNMEESIETMYEMLSIAYTEECKRNTRLNLAFDIMDKECSRLKQILENIEQDTRNTSVVGHPGIKCLQCELCNELAREALAPPQNAKEKDK